MMIGLIYKIKGTHNMRKLGDLYAQHPLLSLLFAIPLFSLVGIPPLSGFWPKLSLVEAGFDTQSYWVIGAILLSSFLTLYVVVKFWSEVFWKPGEKLLRLDSFRYFNTMKQKDKLQLVLPVVFLSLIILYIGFGAENIMELSNRIANELMNTENYIEAVLPSSLN